MLALSRGIILTVFVVVFTYLGFKAFAVDLREHFDASVTDARIKLAALIEPQELNLAVPEGSTDWLANVDEEVEVITSAPSSDQHNPDSFAILCYPADACDAIVLSVVEAILGVDGSDEEVVHWESDI